MFKSGKWRSEKNKIKAVFRLQFQATQVPQLKKARLMVSLIPADVGKPTVRLEKAAVVEGTCVWENFIYETVKLTREKKTGRFKEKIYYFVVSTGSSKAGFLGEVWVDFAEFGEAIKPLMVSLPLQSSNSGAILHVTIQKMQGSVDLREVEENEDQTASSEDKNFNFTEKFLQDGFQECSDNSIERLKSEISMLERQAEVSELEMQSLRKQVVKENKRGQDLSRQILSLKEERDALRTDCEQLKSSQKCLDEAVISNQWQSEYENLSILYEEITRELKHEKESNHTLLLQLQDTENSNSELLLEVKDLDEMLEMNQIEQMKMKNEYSESLATIREFQLQVESLKEEIKKNMAEFSESLEKINELQAQVKCLEKELEKQAQDFEVEQEERAVRAEEALRKTRLNNADATDCLQEEFRKLSVEMASKFDENEKLAMKAVEETNDLRIEKRVLEEKLEKANEELGLIRDEYQEKLQELSNQSNLNEEKKELEREFASIKKESEKLQEESITLRTLKDENETIIETLQSELEKLRVQYNEVNNCLFGMDLEKENLKKQVIKLAGELQNKEDTITSLEKKLKNNSEKAKDSDINLKANSILLKEDRAADKVTADASKLERRTTEGRPRQNGFGKFPIESSKYTISVRETQSEEVLKVHTSKDCDHTQLLGEVASLRQMNKHMEGELKEMQERYSEISLKFAEVEGERQQLVMKLRNLKIGKKN